MSEKWERLIKSIRRGRAVLILGPEAIPYYHNNEVTTFSQLTRRVILEELDDNILHFYERDNLFLFENKRAKQEARDCVLDLAESEEWQPDDELLRQIIAIPFPVILNLNPDRKILDAFIKYWRKPQFDFFSANDKKAVEIDEPDSDNPLLYNLSGDVQKRRDSIILDFNDLFSLLKNLLNDKRVPEELIDVLTHANHYILLGVKLDRWYFQVFLHYINRLTNSDVENTNTNFLDAGHLNEELQKFVLRQFNVKHQALNREELASIYEACEKAGMIRKNIREPGNSLAEQVRKLILNNDLEQAFRILAEKLDPESAFVDITMLQARYNEYLNKKQNELEDGKSLGIELNNIRYALLSYAQKLPEA